MRGWICECVKCRSLTIATDKIRKEDMKCECGGMLRKTEEYNIGVDLALSRCRDMTRDVLKVVTEEGIVAAVDLPRISKDDVLILQSERIFGRKETTAEMQEEIKKRTGMNVALFDGRTKIIGVVEHGS